MSGLTSVSGMILSAQPIGEYDRRVVILTKEYGKISAFAKGARKQTSQLVGCTRGFVFGTFEVYRGRDSYTMYKAYVDNYFDALLTDLDALMYSYYFAEIADYYSRENLDASDMVNLLYVSVKALLNKNIPNELVRYIFELRSIAMNGECPDFFNCKDCGSNEKIVGFEAVEGVVCKKCADTKAGLNIEYISGSTLYTLQYILTAKLARLYTFTVDDKVLIELKRVLESMTERIFDRDFKSKEMLI